jgi:hypothetical protein
MSEVLNRLDWGMRQQVSELNERPEEAERETGGELKAF